MLRWSRWTSVRSSSALVRVLRVSGVRRGELWRCPSVVRDRTILIVSAQPVIDRGVSMLYGVEVDEQDPGAILLVVPVEVAGELRWLNVQRGLTRVYRPTLTESLGLVDRAVLDQLDALLRVALDL
ncbi:MULTISPECIES: hypothetical protein [unclassified Pseudonocardia]|uniref:hypothetical protein n=1 Tax=unclassified Pseudonocardia TaxID=2619320 RepID=UPI00094B3FDA|nr:MULTISPECIES: hypothetical protein [unclassified Pseudonocardia]